MQNKSFKSITTRKRSNIDIISKQVLLNKKQYYEGRNGVVRTRIQYIDFIVLSPFKFTIHIL